MKAMNKNIEVDLTFTVVYPKSPIIPVPADEKVFLSRTRQETYEATIVLPFSLGEREYKNAEAVYADKNLFFEKLYPIMRHHKELEVGYALNSLFEVKGENNV